MDWPMQEFIIRAALEGLIIVPTVVFSVYAFKRIKHTEIHARRAHILYRCALVLAIIEYLLDTTWYVLAAVVLGLSNISDAAMQAFDNIISRASLVEDLFSHVGASVILLCEAQVVAALHVSIGRSCRYFMLGMYVISISVTALSLHFFAWMEWYYTRFINDPNAEPTLNNKDGRIFDAFNDVDAFGWALNLFGALIVLGYAVSLKLRGRKYGWEDIQAPTTYLIAVSAIFIVVRAWDVYTKAEGIQLLHVANSSSSNSTSSDDDGDMDDWDNHGLVMVDCFLHGWLSFLNLVLLFVLLLKKGGSWSEKTAPSPTVEEAGGEDGKEGPGEETIVEEPRDEQKVLLVDGPSPSSGSGPSWMVRTNAGRPRDDDVRSFRTI